MMASVVKWTKSVVVVLIVGAVVTTGGSSAIGTSSVSEQRSDAELQPRVDADDVLLHVSLRPNGSAAWRVEYRIQLNDNNTTAAFKELQRDIRANRSAYRTQFANRIRDTVATAENRTGRAMAANNFTVSTERRQLPQEYGIITYSFEWQGFARTNGTQLQVGDALAGLFLDAETTLVISWSDNYVVSTVTPTPDETRSQAVVWTGPTDFSSGEPTLRLVSETTTQTSGHTTSIVTPTTTTIGGERSDGNGSRLPTVLLGTLLFMLVVGTGILVTRRRSSNSQPTTDDNDHDLLTNEEQVLAILEANDGRVKQQTVVEELGWSEAKTSRVANQLDEADRIEVIRLGRENVLSLPDDSN